MVAPDVEPAEAQVTAGYDLLDAPPGFVRHCGAFYLHERLPVLATRVTAAHLNSLRMAHGGFLATLADSAFGVVLKRDLGLPVSPVTVNLGIDYLGPVREGDWAEAHVEVHKAGSRLINAVCLLKVGDRLALCSHGVFMQPTAPDRG